MLIKTEQKIIGSSDDINDVTVNNDKRYKEREREGKG
jgi:hypothetical protein